MSLKEKTMSTRMSRVTSEEAGDYAETDDYGALPHVRLSGGLRNRSYIPVSDEDMVTEEDDSGYMPMYDVGTEFEITDVVKGLAGLETGIVYRIGAVELDPPTYAIIGAKNRKVAEINAKLFDGIVNGDYDDEEGQDDDAQEDSMGESEEDFQSVLANTGIDSSGVPRAYKAPRRPREWKAKDMKAMHDFLIEKFGSLAGFRKIRHWQDVLRKQQEIVYKKAEKEGALKDAKHPLTLLAADLQVMDVVFAKVIGALSKFAKGKQPWESVEHGGEEDLGEGSDYIGHYHVQGDKTYADTAFMNVIGNTIPGMEMRHLGFGEFELTGDKGTVQFDRMRGKDFEGQSGRSHLVYDDKGGKLVKELIDKLKKAGKIQLVEGVTSEVKMKVPLIFKKKGDKGGKSATLDALKNLRESLIGKDSECGCDVSENTEKDEAMDTLKRLGFSDKDAKIVFDVFMDNMLSNPKFVTAMKGHKGVKLPPKSDWGDVYHRLYNIYD